MPRGTVERGWVMVRLYLGTLELHCKGSLRDAQPSEGAVKVGVAKRETIPSVLAPGVILRWDPPL